MMVIVVVISVVTVVTVVVVILLVLLIVVVARALVCAGALIGTFVVLWTSMRVNVVIVVSNILVNVDANVFPVVMTTFEFVMPGPLAEFRC